ncbi:MAG: hypothetical protein QMC83_03975 [Thermodesulfovibrionales bacterium]|nr:hypothetical protein [Thermodesulfovibrionales bacterium]
MVLEHKKGSKFLTCGLLQVDEFLFLNTPGYSLAEIIDADHLTSPEETSILSKEVTGIDIICLAGKGSP